MKNRFNCTNILVSDSGTVSGLRPEAFEPTPRKPLRTRFSISWKWILIVFVLVVAATVFLYLFTANAVRFTLNVENVELQVKGGLVLPTGETYLMPRGDYVVQANADGYFELTLPITVTGDGDQSFALELQRLPGVVEFTSVPSGAEVRAEGAHLGITPFETNVPAGTSVVRVSAPRYLDSEFTVEIEGMEQRQSFFTELDPDWAMVTIPTEPTGATVLIDEIDSGFITPGPVEILSGEHTVRVTKRGYSSWNDIVFARAGETLELEPITLELLGGELSVNSNPPDASVTINGVFQGTTPLSTSIKSGLAHKVEVLLAGYQQVVRTVRVNSESTRILDLELQPVTGEMVVTTLPEGAEIWVDGKYEGESNTTLTLHAVPHRVELKKEGHAGWSDNLTIQPGFAKEIRVRLLTLEEARLEALKRVRTTSAGQELVLLQPTSIRMGASRRQPGRRANEVFRTAELSRLFYLSKMEVTNKEFREFIPVHDSGEYQGVSLNKDHQPAVNVSWNDAALYCNALSEDEDFEPFYRTEGSDVVGFNPNSLGYRLPTEAEWSWAARHVEDEAELLMFPWGENLPPPDRHGNYADRAAQHVVGRIIFDYNDNHTVAAPVGTFKSNTKEIFDLGGNVAEWIHDFYGIPNADSVVGVTGPSEGNYHVIRGSSWLHGTITDLRLSFRDYGNEGRNDVGFRLARYAE